MCKGIIKSWLFISSVKTHFWVVFFFRVDGSTALLTPLPCVAVLFPLKGNGRNLNWIWTGNECSCLPLFRKKWNEPFLNIFWNLHFDDAEALDYTFAYFDRCNSVSLSYYLCLFAFQRKFCFVLEFFFGKYLLKFFQILYKMQVIVELPLCAFLFASLKTWLSCSTFRLEELFGDLIC